MQQAKRRVSDLVGTAVPFGMPALGRRTTSYVAGHAANGRADTVIASYNIHKAVGRDRKFDPDRTISVIKELDADIIALQEANKRFGERVCLLDMARLERECGLVPVALEEPRKQHGWHGNIILFREGTVTSARPLALPGVEPRGAVVIDLTLAAGPLRVIAAHLGLLHRCRRQQVEMLLSFAEAHDDRPTLLMGDLNEWRLGKRSSLRGLEPAFGPLHATIPSFPARFPVLALDRVLAKPHDLISSVELHDTPLARVASDHLPVKAQISLANGDALVEAA